MLDHLLSLLGVQLVLDHSLRQKFCVSYFSELIWYSFILLSLFGVRSVIDH